MTTAFPTGLDAFTNPAASAALSTDHPSQHANLNDAVEALEAKVGVNNSADPNSLDYKVTVLEGQIAVVAAYNLYKDGANYKYTANGTGSIIIQDGLTVTIYSAPAGNAGDIAVLTSMCAWALSTGDMVVSKASGIGTKVDPAAPTFPWADLIGVYRNDPSGPNAPTMVAFRGGVCRMLAFGTSDVMEIVYHVPHDYVPGTDMYIHVHWLHNGTAISGSLVVDMAHTYSKGHNQQIFPAEKTVTLTVSTPDIATIPRYVHRTDEIQLSSNGGSGTLMDSAQLEVDGIIMVHLALTTKPTITGGTSADVFIPSVDIHYQTTGVNTKQKAPNFYV